MFLCIHLPGLVGQFRSGHVDARPAPARGRVQVVLHEPPLQRARRGDDLFRHAQEQLQADHAAPPGRVLAAHPQGGLDCVRGLSRGVGGAMVGRHEAFGAGAAEPPEEPSDGRACEPERRGDLMGLTALLPELEHGLTDRNGDGAWHGYGSV